MPHNRTMAALCTFVLLFALAADAQETVYDDALQNGFLDYSYGGGADFASTAVVHGGTNSIAFTGNNFNAVSFARPAQAVDTAESPVLRFWVHGGATGGQQLRIYLQLNDAVVADAELDTYIDGGAIAAGQWREVTVDITGGPLAYDGLFDRIDLQSDVNGGQATLHLDDVALLPPVEEPAAAMEIEHGVTVASMLSDRFTWQDSNNQPRVAVLAHNNTAAGPNSARGGALREFRYQLPDGTTRIASVTTYGNAGHGGFGYVVSHASRSACIGGDSPLGYRIGGQFQRVFEGRHHAIFRFTQNYPRKCGTTGGADRTLPVTIDWIFSTGRDHPVWAITYHVDLAGPNAPVGTFYDDSRAPYGELNIDGQGFEAIDGTAWGDRWKFTTTSAPATLDSTWTWNVPNSIPYVKEWIAGPLAMPDRTRDATMGIVQTQTMTQQDAGGGRDPGIGSDITPFWNKTSADGNAGDGHAMPRPNDWPYQANANSLQPAPATSNNARLTWKTQYGFIGQQTYSVNDGVAGTAPGYPKKSYSTYIVLGTHSSGPVEAQVTQVETMQSVTLTADVGTVVTEGPAGIDRADTVTYAPAGYNHVYGALAFAAAGNQLDANIAVGNGTLRNPLVVVSNYSGEEAEVKLAGVTLVLDADYFASPRPAANELWITLNRALTGATNRLEVLTEAPPVAPDAPANLVATAFSGTRIDLTWTAAAGATSYEIDRRAPAGAFTQIGTSLDAAYSDTAATPNTAYLYRVRAVNDAGTSPDSAPDLATAIVFTDATLVVRSTRMRAVHLAQLRTAVNAVRALAGLAASSFTDAATAGTRIKGLHVTQLRSAVDPALTTLGLAAPEYTNPSLTAVRIKAVHVQELRDRVR